MTYEKKVYNIRIYMYVNDERIYIDIDIDTKGEVDLSIPLKATAFSLTNFEPFWSLDNYSLDMIHQ